MKMNMKEIRIEKLTLNVGAGKDQKVLEKALKLLEHVSGKPPVKTITSKRIAGWGLRPGLPIGAKITLRKKQAEQLLPRLLYARDNKLGENNFDSNGNISFGIHEYIDIKDIKYEPDIGMMGLQACLTLERPGFRIKRRKIMKKPLPTKHKIQKTDAMEFMRSKFKIQIGDEE